MAFTSTDNKGETEPFPVRSPEILHSNSTRYQPYEFIGEGNYGKVARCIDLNTGDKVAVKILNECGIYFEEELKAYKALRALDPDKHNVVRFIENFDFNDHSCLVFEMLDHNLWEAVDENGWCVNDIRPVTHQILVALKALADIGIVHTDLKPDNIMLVNHRVQPFRVKLIDFGLAGPVNKAEVGMLMQAYGFRSPEVILGLPLSEAVDMWGLGCTLAYLYFGRSIFPFDSSYYAMREMVRLLGPPEDHLLLDGMYTWRYVIAEPDPSSPTGWVYRFKSPGEYEEEEGIELDPCQLPRVPSLEQAVEKSSGDNSEYHDGMQFEDLLKSCLHWDAAERITPSEALKHSFVTMAHLDQKEVTSSYRCAAHQLMTVCPMEPSDNGRSAAAGSTDGDAASISSTDKIAAPTEEDLAAAINDSIDADCVTTVSNTNDDGASAAAGSTDGDAASISLNDGDVAAVTPVDMDGPKKKKKRKKNLFQRTLKFFRRVRSQAEITSHEIPTGSSATTNLRDGLRDTAAPAEEESAAATGDDRADTDCVTTVSNTNDDGASAAAGSTDGDAASISLNDVAAAAITPVDTDGPKKKKRKKNLFQRILKFFHRVKAPAEITSHENPTGPSVTSTDNRDETEPFPVRSLDILHSNSTRYQVYEFIGEGNYGKVARCIDLNTGDKVAVKILNECGIYFEEELKAYKALRALDPDKHNVVRFIENFDFNDHSCLVFEMLDHNLWEAVDENGWCVNDIRPVTHQILVALKALADIGIIHTDLKPDNIMLVNHRDQPFRVKLIDLGLATPVNKVEVGTLMQAYGFRSPEVILGLPLSEAVDMWGLGCTLAYLYFGRSIFPFDSSYYAMREMVRLLGPPEDHLLLDGMYTWRYVIIEPDPGSPTGWVYRFKSPGEYEEEEDIELDSCQLPRLPSLEQAVEKSSGDNSEYHDGMQFEDLLKSCLHWDAAERITPSEALKHSFVTMAHLDQKEVTSSYRCAAHQLMTVCPMEPSDNGRSAAAGSTDGDAASISSTDKIAAPTEEDLAAAINDSIDADCVTTVSNTNDDGASAAAGSTDGDAASISLNDGDVAAVTPVDMDGPKKKKKKRKKNLFQRTLKFLRRVRSQAEITSHEIPTGSSATTNLRDGLRDTAAPAEEESAAATGDDRADTDCVTTVSNTNDDGASAAAGSTDGDAASISLNDVAAAAITPVDTDGPKKKKRKKNLFQRILKFFHRVTAPAEITSHENPTGPSVTSTDNRDETEPFPVRSLDILHSNSTRYQVYEFIGEGNYGKVARCIDLNTGDKVAVKILNECGIYFEEELKAYKALRALDPDKHNVVRFIENFDFNDHSCLVFEMLDHNLWQAVDENGWCVNDIRPVTHQILVALKALADIGIIHTDLKPDNIMLVNHRDQPFRVKLIDLGLATPVNKVEVGTLMQAYGFRAPEVILGLPLSEAVDMWGLGCTLAYLYFGRSIFPFDSSYYAMREMVRLLGPPEDHLLLDGMYTWRYVIIEPDPSSPTGWVYRFKSPGEYEEEEDIELDPCQLPRLPSLEQAVEKSSGDNSEYHDGMQFEDLLKSCLHWDAAERITPSEALKHSFVTMAHLDQKEVTSSYRCAAHQLMTVCPMEPSDNGRSAAAGSTDGDAASISSTDKIAAPTEEDLAAAINDSIDADCVTTVSNTNDDGASAAAGSTDGDAASISLNDGDVAAVICLNMDGPTGSSTTTNLRDEVRDTAAPTKEESAVATSNDSADTDSVATVSNSNDDRPAAAAGSTDGATAITPVNTHGLTKKKKKNLFQRTLKFFRRVRSRAEITSHENPTGYSVTSDLCDCETDTASPTEEVSAAATNNDSADCLPTVSNSNDYSVSLATVTSDGAAASLSLNDGAVAVIISADADGLKRKKKNLVQRFFTCFG